MREPDAETLFRDHGADVLAYALRRTDPGTAEDVVAEVFLVAFRRADRVPTNEPVLWLYAVARRVLANHSRAARRRQALLDVLKPFARRHAAEPEPDTTALTEALERLRSTDRELLMLTAWEGLDAAQAATVLDCTPQAVHTRLHRARARLGIELNREVREVSIS